MDSIAFYLDLREQTSRKQRMGIRYKTKSIFDVSDALFIKHYRLNKAAFKYVLKELKRKLPLSVRSSSLTPESKLAACCRFLAEGGYQHGVGQDFNICMAQSTFSVVLSEVLAILEEHLMPKWINLQQTEDEKREARAYFYRKSKIPGVVMCIDGTHIKIIKPSGNNAHLFLNRKGFFSLNAMIICDQMQKIRYVDARYPGSSHDSFVWTNSGAFQFFKNLYDNGDRNTRLLDKLIYWDLGYPLSPWLITPFRNAGVNTQKSRFNKSHSSGRNIIERTFGVWKNWCRCCLGARQLHYTPKKCVQVVNVAATLHNIRLHFKVHEEVADELNEEEEEDDDEWSDEQTTDRIYSQQANQLRNSFLSNF